jgi:hypothetical protein
VTLLTRPGFWLGLLIGLTVWRLQKDKEDVEEISTELELADVGDDERVP